MEKDISNQIIGHINNLPGGFAHKRLSNGSTSTNGWPDITGSLKLSLNGQQMAVRLEIEAKQPGKTPDPLQYSMLRQFRRLGMIAFWTNSIEDCKYKLNLWSCVTIGQLEHPGFEDITGSATVLLEDLGNQAA